MYEYIKCSYTRESLLYTLEYYEYREAFLNEGNSTQVESLKDEILTLGFHGELRKEQIEDDFIFQEINARAIVTAVGNIFASSQKRIQAGGLKGFITFCIVLDIVNNIRNGREEVNTDNFLNELVNVFYNGMDEEKIRKELELLKREIIEYPGEACNLLFSNDRVRTIVISLYLALEFESYNPKGWDEEVNSVKSKWQEIIEERYNSRQNIEKMRVSLEENSGKLLSRQDVDGILGKVKDRLNIRVNNRRIAYKATLICYTGASFINKKDVTQAREGNAEEVSDAFISFIKTERTAFDLIITNPYSNAAVDAARFGKLGNNNFKTRRKDVPSYVNTTEPFENAYSSIVKQINTNTDIQRKMENNELNIFITDISLPYALFKIDYVDEYSYLNYIRIDLYSPFLSSNSERKSIIISKIKNKEEYDFFNREIDAYKSVSKWIGEEEFDNGSGIHVFKPEENNQDSFYRRYYTGNRKFNRDDMKISNVELGVSVYNEFKCDKPHYHLTTNEHYYIVSGEQKILDLETGIESLAKEGDVVFIRKRTKHWTKNAPGTKIVFAKSPLKVGDNDKDKVNLKINQIYDVQDWEKSWEGKIKKKGEDIT
ncbi:MAG: hypothetical protein Q4C46_10205 [Bacillota bacterium]|nr:hypothetical protein [Bacillota bacterium]